MLYGLDLFTGIGGLTLALKNYVSPLAYCEKDSYCQRVLLARMQDGRIPHAPIWDNACTFLGSYIADVDIIYGGFPCQDISIAGNGAGLAGKRSSLFYEIVRLASEIKPTFLFLENVPAIASRGGVEVVNQITQIGYGCRWCCLSAAAIGAPHKRDRWWLLGYSEHNGQLALEKQRGADQTVCDNEEREKEASKFERTDPSRVLSGESLQDGSGIFFKSWWASEPDVGRMVNGLPNRVDRIKCLGNAVVPLQARTAFEYLMGITPSTTSPNSQD